MINLKIAGIVLVLFILYVIIGMLVSFVHMKSVSKTNKSKIHTETFYSTSDKNGSDRAKIVCAPPAPPAVPPRPSIPFSDTIS